jgi:outer membrane protein assembly factor BamB
MNLKPFALVITFLAAALLLSGCAQGLMPASWPGIAVSADTAYVAAGQHVFAINLADGREKWRFPERAKATQLFYAAPVLTQDGQLIVAGYDHVLYSLDPASGETKWAFKGGRDRYIAAPLVTQDRIYAPNADYRLYALDLNGNLQWTFEGTQSFWGSPLLEGERLYIGSLDRKVYALRAADGTKVWERDLGAAILSTPATAEDQPLLVTAFDGTLYALDKASGDVLWQKNLGARLWATPLIADNHLYTGDEAGRLHAIDPATGAELWQMDARSAILSTPLRYDSLLAFGCEDGRLQAITLEGTPEWQQMVNGKLYGAPVLAGDLILVAPVEGEYVLIAITPTGAQKWAFKPGK